MYRKRPSIYGIQYCLQFQASTWGSWNPFPWEKGGLLNAVLSFYILVNLNARSSVCFRLGSCLCQLQNEASLTVPLHQCQLLRNSHCRSKAGSQAPQQGELSFHGLPSPVCYKQETLITTS